MHLDIACACYIILVPSDSCIGVDIGIYSIMRLQELPVGLMSVLIPMIIEVWPTIYGPKILILVEITNLVG